MNLLDKTKLVDRMGSRKDALHNQITRDFGGGLLGRVYEHGEVKYWKEAIERGEFDAELPEVYVILSKTKPSIIGYTYYTDRAEAVGRVEYLNSIAGDGEYWVTTLFSNLRKPREEVEV